MRSIYASVKDYLVIIAITLSSTLVLYIPFFPALSSWGLHIPETDTGFIYRHWDGLLYVIAAKSWYDPATISRLPIDVPLDPAYFAAHLPGYPALIWLVAQTGMTYVHAMVVATLLGSVLFAVAFYTLITRLKLSSHPVLLTVAMLFLPRLLVVRSIGAPEPLFIAFIMFSLVAFEHKRYVLAGVLGGVATMIKLPGILLFVAYGLAFLESMIRQKRFNFKFSYVGIILIPVGLLAVCSIYLLRYNDFFAYWHTGYMVPMGFPYAMFDKSARWVGTGWLEEIILYLGIYLFATVSLWRSKHRSLFYFMAIFWLGVVTVQHRDISRYSLPMWPIAAIFFERTITSKAFLITLLILIPGIYLYSWNFMLENVMPVSNWAPFL